MMDIERAIRNYTFRPTGETIRGLEITIGTALVLAVPSKGVDILDWRHWAFAAGAAGVEAGVGFIKGKLPPKSTSHVS